MSSLSQGGFFLCRLLVLSRRGSAMFPAPPQGCQLHDRKGKEARLKRVSGNHTDPSLNPTKAHDHNLEVSLAGTNTMTAVILCCKIVSQEGAKPLFLPSSRRSHISFQKVLNGKPMGTVYSPFSKQQCKSGKVTMFRNSTV